MSPHHCYQVRADQHVHLLHHRGLDLHRGHQLRHSQRRHHHWRQIDVMSCWIIVCKRVQYWVTIRDENKVFWFVQIDVYLVI